MLPLMILTVWTFLYMNSISTLLSVSDLEFLCILDILCNSRNERILNSSLNIHIICLLQRLITTFFWLLRGKIPKPKSLSSVSVGGAELLYRQTFFLLSSGKNRVWFCLKSTLSKSFIRKNTNATISSTINKKYLLQVCKSICLLPSEQNLQVMFLQSLRKPYLSKVSINY